MAQILHHRFSSLWRKWCTAFLALSMLAGFLFGMTVYVRADFFFLPMMRRSVAEPVSIVSLLLSLYLPFVLSAFAVYVSAPGMLLFICFGKSFLFALMAMGVWDMFGYTGWIVYMLLFFAEFLSFPVLYFFWQRHISGESKRLLLTVLLFSPVFLLIGSVFFRLISPLLAQI